MGCKCCEELVHGKQLQTHKFFLPPSLNGSGAPGGTHLEGRQGVEKADALRRVTRLKWADRCFETE